MVSCDAKWYYKHLSPGIWYVAECLICFLWLPRALSIVHYIHLFGHLPRALCISQINFPYSLAEIEGGTLPYMYGTNILILRMKSKIPVGLELKGKGRVFPALNCVLSAFLFKINPFFPATSPAPTPLEISDCLYHWYGCWTLHCNLSCLWGDRLVLWFCSQMWFRFITHGITVKVLIGLCCAREMGTILLIRTLWK